eukprot:TRINITY_DN3199_c0_g1_i1.p1 TRINITY_DN3199_c0_g1~~TRINITY_DN3199_c0_g1_i1.p1  ORF type:complete len:327 (+),score=42.58 TRINITY_DN3199_c0_g1_i1:84-1064(+)
MGQASAACSFVADNLRLCAVAAAAAIAPRLLLLPFVMLLRPSPGVWALSCFMLGIAKWSVVHGAMSYLVVQRKTGAEVKVRAMLQRAYNNPLTSWCALFAGMCLMLAPVCWIMSPLLDTSADQEPWACARLYLGATEYWRSPDGRRMSRALGQTPYWTMAGGDGAPQDILEAMELLGIPAGTIQGSAYVRIATMKMVLFISDLCGPLFKAYKELGGVALALQVSFLAFFLPQSISIHLAPVCAVVEDVGPIDSLKRSRQVTKGIRGRMFFEAMLLSLITVTLLIGTVTLGMPQLLAEALYLALAGAFSHLLYVDRRAAMGQPVAPY